jgi:hypothetical protein
MIQIKLAFVNAKKPVNDISVWIDGLDGDNIIREYDDTIFELESSAIGETVTISCLPVIAYKYLYGTVETKVRLTEGENIITMPEQELDRNPTVSPKSGIQHK